MNPDDANVDPAEQNPAEQNPTEQVDSSATPTPEEGSGAQQQQTIPKPRFDEVYGRMRGFERSVAEKDKQIKELQEKLDLSSTAAQTGANNHSTVTPEMKVPTLEAAGYDEGAYTKMMADYYSQMVDKTVSNRMAAEQQRLAQEQIKAQDRKTMDAYAAAEANYAATNPDFIKRRTDNQYVPFSDDLSNAIIRAQAPEVLDYLYQNPTERMRIEELSPTAKAVEIGKILGRTSQTKTKQISNAPNPVEDVRGGPAGDSSLADAPNAEEYARRRLSQMQKGRENLVL